MEEASHVRLIIGIEERLSWWQNILYAIQQLTVDTTVLIVPILLARALQLPPETGAFLLQASLIGAGLVTIGQSLWSLKWPVLQGPAIICIRCPPAVVAVSGLAEAWTGLVIASALAAVLSLLGVWGRLRSMFGYLDGDNHYLTEHRQPNRRRTELSELRAAFQLRARSHSLRNRVARRTADAVPAARLASSTQP
jgi:hypothetical protein